MGQILIGSKVKVLSKSTGNYSLAKVLEEEPDMLIQEQTIYNIYNGEYKIRGKNRGTEWNFKKSDLELIEETKEENEPKELKPGDKVEVITTVTFKVGDILTVIEKVPGQCYYYIVASEEKSKK